MPCVGEYLFGEVEREGRNNLGNRMARWFCAILKGGKSRLKFQRDEKGIEWVKNGGDLFSSWKWLQWLFGFSAIYLICQFAEIFEWLVEAFNATTLQQMWKAWNKRNFEEFSNYFQTIFPLIHFLFHSWMYSKALRGLIKIFYNLVYKCQHTQIFFKILSSPSLCTQSSTSPNPLTCSFPLWHFPQRFIHRKDKNSAINSASLVRISPRVFRRHHR